MSDEDYNIRTSVWEAISNFYLDTELDDKDYDYISKTLINSRLNLYELKEIDLYEVFPSLQINLLGSAGEWAGFDSAWLNENCMKNYVKRINSKSFKFQNEMKNKIHFWMRKKHWQEIEKRMKSAT